MTIISTGALITTAGIVWKFWRVPVRLWQWRAAEEVEPAAGQLWRSAGFSGPNSDWMVEEVEDDYITIKSTTDKDAFKEFMGHELTWDQWEEFVKSRRLWCKDADQSMEDKFWGDASED